MRLSPLQMAAVSLAGPPCISDELVINLGILMVPSGLIIWYSDSELAVNTILMITVLLQRIQIRNNQIEKTGQILGVKGWGRDPEFLCPFLMKSGPFHISVFMAGKLYWAWASRIFIQRFHYVGRLIISLVMWSNSVSSHMLYFL